MTAEAVSPELLESTRKNGAQILAVIMQRLAEVTRVRAATSMGVHGSTVSRMASDDLEQITLLLAALELQVAPADALMISQDELYAIEQMAAKYLVSKVEMRRGMGR